MTSNTKSYVGEAEAGKKIHSTLFMIGFCGIALVCGIIICLVKKPNVKNIFHPKVWLSLWGGIFILTVGGSLLAPGGGVGSDCPDEWNLTHNKEFDHKILHMCTSYEWIWSGSLFVHVFSSLAYAWLLDGHARAKMALLFGLVMLFGYMPGLYVGAGGYDVPPPAAAYPVFGGLNFCIALSGYLHLDPQNVDGKEVPLLR